MTTPLDIMEMLDRLCAGTAVTYALAEVAYPDEPAALSQLAIQSLTPTERVLLGGLRSAKRRAEFCAGRIAAKRALDESPFRLTAINPEIGRSSLGAPILLGHQQSIHLSITHSGSYAVAVVADCPIGIDLERNEARPEAFAQLFLTPAERDKVQRMPPITQGTLINHFWCRKEAACKVGGWGATLPFGSMDCSQAETTVDGRRIHLLSCGVKDYVACLAREVSQTVADSFASSQAEARHG